MLPFRNGKRQPRNYLARREQWRLLLVVLTLGLVVILYLEARNPANFRWIDVPWHGEKEPENRLAEPRHTEQKPDSDVPGAFVAPLPSKDTRSEVSGGKTGLPEVRSHDLSSIRDDTPFRKAESDAWFHLLDVLRKTPTAAIRKASIGRVTYTQLAEQPEAYRGELVTLLGTVRRAHRVTAPANDYGIDGYYQLWLQPESNPDDPIVVYSLDVPEGFPIGMSVQADVRITGFFFKRWSYLAQDTLRSAPTVLSQTVDWLRRPTPASQATRSEPSIWLVLGVATVAAALGMIYVYFRTKREKRPAAETIVAPQIPED
jgi:hypothetical protein